jgi:hypothetical protein
VTEATNPTVDSTPAASTAALGSSQTPATHGVPQAAALKPRHHRRAVDGSTPMISATTLLSSRDGCVFLFGEGSVSGACGRCSPPPLVVS